MFRLVSHVSETFRFNVKSMPGKKDSFSTRKTVYVKRGNDHFASKSWTHSSPFLRNMRCLCLSSINYSLGSQPWEQTFHRELGEKKENRILVFCTMHRGWGCRPWFLCTFILPLHTFRLSVKVVFSVFFFQSVFSALLHLSESLQRQWKFLNTEEKLGIWLWHSSGCWNKSSSPRRRRTLIDIY